MNLRAPVGLALLLAASGDPIEAQRATFSAKTEAVRVDVLVTDNGRPLLGLMPADFELLDNGVAQQIDHASFEQIPLNVILTLDMSDSVAGERLDDLRSAGRSLLGALKKDEHAALITFSHVVTLGSELTTDFDRVRAGIEAAEPTGGTGLVDASFASIMLGESDVERSLVLVFSDGLDTASWLAPDAVLDVARRSDAVVYGITAGRLRRGDFLRDLSELTGGRLYEVESTADLGPVFVGVLEEFRHRYLLSYSPNGVSKDGWHRLEVRVKRRGATVKARPGYLAGS
ncbi:MAG TPA: VWA domain-containing protein [Vicinamibacterales bacterium]|nr:VWA domain-containing protein [Vicinamibacterales bacterium]